MNIFATNTATHAPAGSLIPVRRDVVVREIERSMRIGDKTLREAAKEVAVSFAATVQVRGGDQAAMEAARMEMLQFVVTIAGEMLDEIGAR